MNIQKELTITKNATAIQFKAVHIVKHSTGSAAFIQFEISFDNGTTEIFELKKEGSEFNDFFNAWNDMKYLYKEVFNALNFEVEFPVGDMNDTILNPVSE